jgi:MoaA/NifB/PqqE/SkfB family radical SAM enzyme
MDWSTFCDAVAFCRGYGDEYISIGGGEPTLHPRFFDILRICLEDFEYVWMATNGSKTKIMWRLARIIDGEDFDQDDPDNDYYEGIYQEDKLTVALSTDYYHKDIDPKVRDFWKRRSENRGGGYEVRDVTRTDGPSAQGRAKRTGAGWSEDCVCPGMFIRPDGKIKPCGCTNSPIIGDVRNGIEEDWEKILQSDDFQYAECYTSWKKRKEKEHDKSSMEQGQDSLSCAV